MTVYQIGSMGPEVRQIQQRLQGLGLYSGPLDGSFGGGTQSAVRAFQSANQLGVDGQVGPLTWQALFPQTAPPAPTILSESLATRCLALTGSIETSMPPPDCFAGLSGDFDGQGLSFGALQWCLGQNSLQPLFKAMRASHGQQLKNLFGSHYDEFSAMLDESLDEQMAWARSIQSPRFQFNEPWNGMLKALGRTAEFQAIEEDQAAMKYQDALAMCRTYGLASGRAVALMFDIRVQNGSISDIVKAQIMADAAKLTPEQKQDETALLVIIATRRAEAANPKWVADVKARKLMIANGQGVVHGRTYDLAGQYGITLATAAELA